MSITSTPVQDTDTDSSNSGPNVLYTGTHVLNSRRYQIVISSVPSDPTHSSLHVVATDLTPHHTQFHLDCRIDDVAKKLKSMSTDNKKAAAAATTSTTATNTSETEDANADAAEEEEEEEDVRVTKDMAARLSRRLEIVSTGDDDSSSSRILIIVDRNSSSTVEDFDQDILQHNIEENHHEHIMVGIVPSSSLLSVVLPSGG